MDIHFVTGAGHPLAGQTQITLEQILEYPLILTEKNMSYRAALDDLLSQNGRETMPIMEVGDTQLIRNLLCQGLGISYLPEFVIAEDLAKGNLVSLPMTEIQPDIWRQLLYHRNKWISPELKCVNKIPAGGIIPVSGDPPAGVSICSSYLSNIRLESHPEAFRYHVPGRLPPMPQNTARVPRQWPIFHPVLCGQKRWLPRRSIQQTEYQ